mmetsp:Transcript_19763/g.42941  ORF Transcript_19763/g.42941 Transcript_19763/m.42941 type:complete len:332 (+) Transcript_19763:1351-2346(+)
MATRGSTPKAAAVSALTMAICASSSLVGCTLTAQSPYTSTRSGRHMKKTEETRVETPGSFRTCIAGRMVAAVVWMAPDTMPSASPQCTIITPNVLTSLLTMSAAAPRDGAFLPRASTKAAAYFSSLSEFSGLCTLHRLMSTPSFLASAATAAGSPSSVTRARPRCVTSEAAARMRLSRASGSTMCWGLLRQSALMLCWNILGVSWLVRGLLCRRWMSALASMYLSNSIFAREILRVEVGRMDDSMLASALITSNIGLSTDSTGSREPRYMPPSSMPWKMRDTVSVPYRRSTWVLPALVSRMPATLGPLTESCAASSASTTSSLSWELTMRG